MEGDKRFVDQTIKDADGKEYVIRDGVAKPIASRHEVGGDDMSKGETVIIDEDQAEQIRLERATDVS